MRKALIVGIDHYPHLSPLFGCVSDALNVERILARHANGGPNFVQPLTLLGKDSSLIVRHTLKEAVRELFDDDHEIALFYFSGHGYLEATGGYLCTSDSRNGDDGLSMSEIMTFVNSSPSRNKVVILDCCYSGGLGERPLTGSVSEISEGVTILTASTKDQPAAEIGGAGVFTKLLVDALNGAASDLLGRVTPGSVYAHIDQSLGSWSQRPIFKTNVKSFVSLRQTHPPLPVDDLRRLAELFPEEGYEYQLAPSFEPTHIDALSSDCNIFAILQKYNRVNLLIPVEAPHMWHAAVESKRVKLTATGEHYRRLVKQDLI